MSKGAFTRGEGMQSAHSALKSQLTRKKRRERDGDVVAAVWGGEELLRAGEICEAEFLSGEGKRRSGGGGAVRTLWMEKKKKMHTIVLVESGGKCE